MKIEVFDDRVCVLGEGPLWHPVRRQFFWFDILGHKLLSRTEDGPEEWTFDEAVSAAGWVNEDTLLIASETALWRLDLISNNRERVVALEANNKTSRSNDGRADPQGGFWIGTMGFNAEHAEGAIYRYFKGELRKLFPNITIPNAICFAPEGDCAYFTDTPTRQVMRVSLDAEGWPAAEPEVFLDLTAAGLNPDGAVVDKDGTVWLAQWGASRVAAYARNGDFVMAIDLPAEQISCTAFGGADLRALYVTSAAEGLSQDLIDRAPHQGKTFVIEKVGPGHPEPRVLL